MPCRGKCGRTTKESLPCCTRGDGILDTFKLGNAVVMLHMTLDRLNAATTDEPTFHLGGLHKQNGEWLYFRSGSGDESTGLHTVDGDHPKEPDEET